MPFENVEAFVQVLWSSTEFLLCCGFDKLIQLNYALNGYDYWDRFDQNVIQYTQTEMIMEPPLPKNPFLQLLVVYSSKRFSEKSASITKTAEVG